MRRSRQRKGKSGSKQVGTLNVSRASSGPRYEVFTIPTPRGYLSKGASESNMETSLTDRKRPASNPEHVGAPTSFGTPQHVVVGQCYSDCSHDSQRSLVLLSFNLSSLRVLLSPVLLVLLFPLLSAPTSLCNASGVKRLFYRLRGDLPLFLALGFIEILFIIDIH